MHRTPPSDPGRHPDSVPDPVPDDWPSLWGDLLRVRNGEAGHRTARLVHAGLAGWIVDGPCSASSAARFESYKPLLDARHADQPGNADDGNGNGNGNGNGERSGPPSWAVAQLGQSLDACIATATGDSRFVTGPESLLHLHRLRALCDAVLVGAGTVVADDPQLTTRRVPGPHPVRVVFDPAARLDGRARLFHDGQARTLWLCDTRHAAAAQAALARERARADVLAVDGLLGAGDRSRDVHPARALAALARHDLRLVFVEGGGITVSRFLEAGALDRLHLCIAPVLIGHGRRGLSGPARVAMADCPRPPARVLSLGDDVLWDLDLRRSAPRTD